MRTARCGVLIGRGQPPSPHSGANPKRYRNGNYNLSLESDTTIDGKGGGEGGEGGRGGGEGGRGGGRRGEGRGEKGGGEGGEGGRRGAGRGGRAVLLLY